MDINQPDANPGTPTEGNSHYVGTRILLGKTMCFGEAGHCDMPNLRQKFDVRVRPPMKPIKIYMNITRTMKNPEVVNTIENRTHITLVVVDQNENPLPINAVQMDGLSLVARDGV